MSEMTVRPDSLVLYKNRPARVRQVGEKFEIELEGGKVVRVRPKDVSLLHPGPLRTFDQLRPQAGEVKTAWEILAGNETSLDELADLAFGAYTPATAWAAWQLVADGLYFQGTPAKIVACPPEAVAQEQATRDAKLAAERAWLDFLERARSGQTIPEDDRYLNEVEELALARRANSRVLKELGRIEDPENAQALLLELGRWDHTVDPHPTRFGLETSAPAAKLPDLLEEPRLDLTHLPAFAIDDEGNQDPDDALSLDGNRLWVHIADVAALVHPDSEADLEARRRGASLYLPEGTVAMLPARATGVLGLGLADVSPALSFGLDLDSEAQVVGVEVVPAWVQVARLTYAEAETQLEQEPLQSLHRLAQRCLARRLDRGAIEIDLPEVKVRVVAGRVHIRPLPPLRSRGLVREAMLLAGEAMARFALDHSLPFPFTTQDPPDGAKEPGEGLAGMFALRRYLKRSQQRSVPAAHAGLGLEVYAQATSPLRRYLDLVVHQQLRAYLRGERLLTEGEVLERVGAAEAISGSVRRAERLATRHWTVVYFLQHPGWQGEGVLVETRGKRGRVIIPELGFETQIHLRRDLPLNSTVRLALTGVNLPNLEAHFQVR
ncbi:MAG: ribonuclease catalytic domain-containing protein [Anaerolineae bacterium]